MWRNITQKIKNIRADYSFIAESSPTCKDQKFEKWYCFGIMFTFPFYLEGRREGEFPLRSPVGGKRYRGGQTGPSYVALCTKGGRRKTDRGNKSGLRGTDRDAPRSLGR
jgi:hypothetical protein